MIRSGGRGKAEAKRLFGGQLDVRGGGGNIEILKRTRNRELTGGDGGSKKGRGLIGAEHVSV